MSIESILSRPVATLSAKATCAEAARSMRRQNIGSIVVIEEDGMPIGIVTDRDLAMRLVADERDAGSVTVDRVMSAFPAFSNPHRDLRAAIDVMLEMGVRRLPAVNAKGQVVGILSLDDILVDLAGQMGKIKALLELERDQPSVEMDFAVDADAYR
jgi:CBS domain-containing protein